jgi:hypothetical protein
MLEEDSGPVQRGEQKYPTSLRRPLALRHSAGRDLRTASRGPEFPC